MSNPPTVISLTITEFPQNLLIPDTNNGVKIQVVNNSNKNESFKFVFDGQNMDVEPISEDLTQQVEFAASETKNLDLKLSPTTDGYGKLTISVYWLKAVQYTVKIQKIRETSPISKFKDIFAKYSFKKSEVADEINVEEYFIEITLKELKQNEEELALIQERMSSPVQLDSANHEVLPKPTEEEIDKRIMRLAKGYLSNDNLNKSLEFALKLSKSEVQVNTYTNLLRAYSFKNIDEALSTIKNLDDLNLKQQLYKSLVLDRLSENPLQVITLIENIESFSLKTKLLFNIAKELKNKSNLPELISILHKIAEILFKTMNLTNLDKKNTKLVFEFLRDVLILLAEIENPTAVDTILKGIEIPDLKEKLEKDVFKVVYEMVDEIRTKIESELVFSQFFLLNTYVSNINNEIKNFSRIGGNVSNNILSGEFKFSVALLSLFSFDFSIFPFIDRVFNDLKFNSNKTIGYFIFPSNDNFKTNELTTLNTTLTQFFKKSVTAQNQLLVLNLDFIPYLGKPTIILSSESQPNNNIEKKLNKLGDKISIIVDDTLFKGGAIYDNLKQIFGSGGRGVINLVLSYEFLNDYNIFKNVIQSLL